MRSLAMVVLALAFTRDLTGVSSPVATAKALARAALKRL